MNIALIGLGRWGTRFIPKLIENESFENIYCFDSDKMRMASVSEEFPLIKVLTDYETVVASTDIDAVFITTPVASHYPLAKCALEHGKHVFVEKPLTDRRTDAEHLVELAEQRDLKLMVDHITVYSGAARSLRKVIASGSMGRPLFLNATRAGLGIIQQDVSVVWDLAVHEFALIDYLFGAMPCAVSATGSAFYGHLEEIANAALFFESGLVAHVHVSWLSPLKIRRLMICGTEKMLLFDDTFDDNKLMLFDRRVEKSRIASGSNPVFTYHNGDGKAVSYDCNEPLVAVINEFVRSIDEEREPLTSGSVGLRIIKILEAVEKSIKQQGAKVELS
jgi:predicted dehydrogenase